MFVEPETLGRQYPITVSGRSATLELPILNPNDPKAGELFPPLVAAESLSKYLDSWGSVRQDARMQLAEISSVLVNVEVHSEVEGDIAGRHVGGEDIQNLARSVQDWVESFIEWIWCLTFQSIDKDHPDPIMFARKSIHAVYAATAGAVASRPSIGTYMRVSLPDFDGYPSSERAVDNKTLETASTRAGSQLPLILELLASARMFCRRGDRRRAIIDAGIAAEAVLTRLVPSPTGPKSPTLGNLVNQCPLVEIDAQVNLVDPRNDAVHRGIIPSREIMERALEIVEGVALRVEADARPAENLRHFFRPGRLDLVLMRPTDNPDESE